MYSNAQLFNGREHPIAQHGLKLLEHCSKRIQDRSAEIINLETLVQTNLL